jgi:hypothetical protein
MKEKKINKWTNDLNRHFSKEEVHMPNKYMKCSVPSAIKELAIKT